ncbi:hypothetical protein CWC16_19745, partial [Pseudoalteromonas sp. S3776]|uniref:hypothetical protein n=1 Tax=Pseudoalteromonas sp. S3776 TaxID=579544 RepID=UPI00127B0EB0
RGSFIVSDFVALRNYREKLLEVLDLTPEGLMDIERLALSALIDSKGLEKEDKEEALMYRRCLTDKKQ